MSSDFLQSIHCVSRGACATCRASPEFRKAFSAPEECPYGITLHTIPPFDKDAYSKARRKSPPSLMKRAANFAAAAAQHIAAGAPMASDEEVARRFSICQGCEFYDGKACSKCGCPVVRERKYLSKLSWADQSCPVGKWGPAANG